MDHTVTGDGAPATAGSHGRDGEIDWQAIERSPEFQELVTRRRRFIVPATIVFTAGFLAFLLLMALAPGVVGTEIADNIPLAWPLAMSQVFLTWAVTWAYLRTSDREFAPLEQRAAERAMTDLGRHEGAGATDGARRARRFERSSREVRQR